MVQRCEGRRSKAIIRGFEGMPFWKVLKFSLILVYSGDFLRAPTPHVLTIGLPEGATRHNDNPPF